jgi:hypothetical protein
VRTFKYHAVLSISNPVPTCQEKNKVIFNIYKQMPRLIFCKIPVTTFEKAKNAENSVG